MELLNFVRLALLETAIKVEEQGVEGGDGCAPEERKGWDVWLGNVWGRESMYRKELDSPRMREMWSRLAPDEVRGEVFLEGRKGIKSGAALILQHSFLCKNKRAQEEAEPESP